MQKPFVRLVHADDDRGSRRLTEIYLKENHHYQLCASCKDGEEAVTAVQRWKPDILLLDLRMEPKSGHFALRKLRELRSSVKVIIYSAYVHRQLQLFLLRHGVAGFLSKDDDEEQLYRAIDTVAAGHAYVQSDLVGMDPHSEAYKKLCITEQDLQLVQLVKEGGTKEEQARQLGVSTTKWDILKNELIKKTGAKSFPDAVDWLGQHGFIFRDGE